MNSILSEFFRGSLTPAEQRVVNGSEMARVVDEMSKTAELLEQTLPPELQPILQRLTEAQLAISGVGSEAFYIEGFKTGARFMLAIMDDDSENLKPVKA